MIRTLIAFVVLGSPVFAQPGSAPAPAPAVAAAPGPYRLAKGPHETGEVDRLVLKDAARGKDLEMTVRFPKSGAGGPWPVVVFSHGAGGSRNAFAELCRHWASWGYVTISPTHSDSIQLRRAAGEKPSEYTDAIKNVDPMGRVADVKFILDSLGEIEARVPELKRPDGSGRLDRQRIGMAGHSAGALTTQMMLGVKVRGRRIGGLEPRSEGDARVKAGIIVSGQGTNNRLLTDDSWKGIATPWLVITGSEDGSSRTGETPATRREPFEKADGPDKYLLFIEGATHSSYQGKGPGLRLDKDAPRGDKLKMIADATSSTTLAFLDRYLKGDADAGAWLKGGGVAAMTAGKAAITSK